MLKEFLAMSLVRQVVIIVSLNVILTFVLTVVLLKSSSLLQWIQQKRAKKKGG